jgi:Insect pheromone-binding family, A10/OS-D
MHQYRALVLLAVLAAAAHAAPADKYTTKYDTVDIDSILASERLLNNYHNCLIEKGPCTPEALELRGAHFSRISTIYFVLIIFMSGSFEFVLSEL